MKNLNQYICESEIIHLNEGLLSKLFGWFKKLYKNQISLKDDNNTLKVDIKNIKGPEKPAKLEEITSNKAEMEIINDKQVGFPVTANFIKQKSKYLSYEDSKGEKHEYENVEVNRYFYVDGNNKYDIGMILFDDSNTNDNNFTNLISLEVIAKVDNLSEVQKFIHDSFEDSKKDKFKGIQHYDNETRISSILMSKLQYKKSNTNEKILFKEIK